VRTLIARPVAKGRMTISSGSWPVKRILDKIPKKKPMWVCFASVESGKTLGSG